MFGVKITDKLKHIYKYPLYEIAVGRNQRGNDTIIDLYDDVKEYCYWFHSEKDSSKHVILYLQDKVSTEELNTIFNDIVRMFEGSVVYCKLTDVVKTKTPGLVITRNEKRLKGIININKK
jgi:predicted ribosome quality control (RQC) complex YloA/Tae2 family protein